MICPIERIERNVDDEFHHLSVVDQVSIDVYVGKIACSCGDGGIVVASNNGIAELINANKNTVNPIHALFWAIVKSARILTMM